MINCAVNVSLKVIQPAVKVVSSPKRSANERMRMDQSAEKDIIRNCVSLNPLVKEVSKPPMLEEMLKEMPEELEDDARRKKMTRKILKSPKSKIPMTRRRTTLPKPLEPEGKQVVKGAVAPKTNGIDNENGHFSDKLIV